MNYNYFYCLVKNGTKDCKKNLLGRYACESCRHDRKCDVCGRRGTLLCEKCENKEVRKMREIEFRGKSIDNGE